MSTCSSLLRRLHIQLVKEHIGAKQVQCVIGGSMGNDDDDNDDDDDDDDDRLCIARSIWYQ